MHYFCGVLTTGHVLTHSLPVTSLKCAFSTYLPFLPPSPLSLSRGIIEDITAHHNYNLLL